MVLAAGGRCFAEAEARGELSTNHPNATGEVTRIAVEAGAETRDLDALQYHPNGGAWPSDDAGLLDSRDDARLRRGPAQRGRRGVHRLARPARRGRRRRSSTRSRRARASRRPTAAGGLARHDAHRARADAEISLPYMLRRYRGAGHRPARGADLHLPRPPLPERWARDRRARGDDARRRLRLRRDRGRHPRKEPHDGKLAARVRRLRASGRQGGGGEEPEER